MDFLSSNAAFMLFFFVGTIAVASSILVVAMRNPVHSALFLLTSFLSVAILFFMMGAEFVGAVQILVYAGGIMVLFLFVVMLINVRQLPQERMMSRGWQAALVVGLGMFLIFAAAVRTGRYAVPVDNPAAFGRTSVDVAQRVTNAQGQSVVETRSEVRSSNAEMVGMSLYSDYLVPFEVASVFLLVAMIGAIVIGKRELLGEDEDLTPDFILNRARTEREVKEATGA